MFGLSIVGWMIVAAFCGVSFAFIEMFFKRKRNKKFYAQMEDSSKGIKNGVRVFIKTIKYKKMKIMDEYGKELLEWYMKGFRDELNGSTSVDAEDKLLMKAYMTGAGDALIGDDISSVDERPPNLTSVWIEATKMKNNGEISDTQLLKIFRVLSRMRNNGDIILNQ